MKLNLQSPWVTYNNKIKALFANDEDISVSDVREDDDGVLTMAIGSSDYHKYVALDRVIAKRVEFGNVTLRIKVVQLNHIETIEDTVELYKTIFEGNKIVRDIRVLPDFTGTEHCFIRFNPEVVQFFNDDISDYDGNWSGLAQDIAKEVFQDCAAGVHFCTANVHENVEEN